MKATPPGAPIQNAMPTLQDTSVPSKKLAPSKAAARGVTAILLDVPTSAVDVTLPEVRTQDATDMHME